MGLTSILDTALDRTLIGYGNVGYLVRRRSWHGGELPSLAGKVVIVTGAKTGLGKATVTGLARLGAKVHMVVRGREAAEEVRLQIRGQVPGADLVVDECDVSLLADVRAYAGRWEGPLYAMIHNAGVMPERRTVNAEGNELTLATHVLGPHLLTKLLRPALAAGAPSRVLWVSSGGMYSQKLPADDLQYLKQDYKGATAYARTKRMQVVLAQEWAEQLRGDGIVVHSVHPGWVDTPGVADSLPTFKAITRPILRTPQQGADTSVWLTAAEAPGQSTGRFWHDRAARPEHYLRTTRESASDRRALWSAVEALTG